MFVQQGIAAWMRGHIVKQLPGTPERRVLQKTGKAGVCLAGVHDDTVYLYKDDQGYLYIKTVSSPAGRYHYAFR